MTTPGLRQIKTARLCNAGAEGLRRRIASTIIGLTSGGGSPQFLLSEPVGDPGLFGPDSVAWRVHADFTAMLVGGVSALLLQALHPLALAGVWDHSNFREDILGRLRRTASFITGTTYGGCQTAASLIERVRAIHEEVVGTVPDGRPYAAGDPDLLTWVHVAEMNSFLRSYLRYVDDGLSGADQDRYFEEVALIAERLGATRVPRCRRAVESYCERMRPQLAYTERTREVVRILLDAPSPNPALRPLGRVLLHAGVDLLPEWAQAMMGLHHLARARSAVVRPSVHLIAPVMRWGVRRSAAQVARERARAGSGLAV